MTDREHECKGRTVKGVTYYARYECARSVAESPALGTLVSIRLRSYELGWAIQREAGGPYWNEKEASWR